MLAIRHHNAILALGLVAVMTFVSGCKFDNKPCAKEVSETVDLKPVGKSGHLLMSVEKLDFLNDSTIVWDDIELNVTVKGKRNSTENISLSFNGFKFNRKDGRRHLEGLEYLKNKNHSSSKFKLHKMYLNGAEPFHMFLARIKKNNGQLQVHLNGKKLEIVDAKMTFKGKSYSNCPEPSPTPGSTPTPTPTPVPVAPETTLDSKDPSRSPTSSTTISFMFSSNMEGSSFYCALDNSAPVKCTSPQSYSDLSNGSHTFKVYAQSAQGLSDDSPASYTWSVDAVAPTASITNSSSLPTLTKEHDISFEFSASKPNSTFKCSLDGGASVTCSSPMVYTGLSEGVHLFSVNAIDSLGNVGKVPDTFRWTVDATAPVASFIDISPGDAVSNIQTRSFTFSADESANFECSLDGAAYASCVSPVVVQNLSEGMHSFAVRPSDAAGNQGLAISYAFEIDLTAPVLSLGAVSPAQGLTNAKNISVEFAMNEAGTVYCSLDGGAAQICQSPFTASDLAEGAHSLQITAADASGNMAAAMDLSWEMDFTAPSLSFAEILPSAASLINVNNLEISVNAPQGTVLYASVDGAPAKGMTNPLRLENLSEGSHSVAVHGVDSVGNVSSAIVHSFAIDMTAPMVSLVAQITKNPTNSDYNAFEISSNDEAIFECNFDNGGFGECSSSVAYSGLADGEHVLQVRAKDAAGNVSSIAQYAWVVDTKAPTTGISVVINGQDATFTMSSDESDVRYLCSLDGEVLGDCTSPLTRANLRPGMHTMYATAIDAAGNSDTVGSSYTFEILNQIRASITSVTPNQSPTNQMSLEFKFAANQPNATFMCAVDNNPLQPCISPTTITVNVEGTHKFTVKAVDAYGNMEATAAVYNWVFDPSAPQITSLTIAQTTTTVTLTFTTNEPAVNQVVYGLGTNMNQSTAETTTYTTTHTVKLTGLFSNSTYSYQIKVRDVVGNLFVNPTRTVRTNR